MKSKNMAMSKQIKYYMDKTSYSQPFGDRVLPNTSLEEAHSLADRFVFLQPYRMRFLTVGEF
jgi:hypothetical protein